MELLLKHEGPLKFIGDEPEFIEFKEGEIVKFKFNRDNFSKLAMKCTDDNPYNINNSNLRWRPVYPDTIEKVTWDTIFVKCKKYRFEKKYS
jgi:hypothetical protein